MAAADYNLHRLSSPQVYLWRMILFVIAAGVIGVILYRQLASAFLSNPGLNGLILGVLIIGIMLSLRQVVRLFAEIKWVNDFRFSDDPGIHVRTPPVLLAPMATLLGDKRGRMRVSTNTTRSILDSVGTRLDESRDISRYMIGLLIFLGLLGTFWGLLRTIGAVGETIGSLSADSNEASEIFASLKAGLEAPLAGMGTAFSSSLFGLAGSLVLGFLDLQANQAQNRFYIDLEDWLTTLTEVDPVADPAGSKAENNMEEAMVHRLEETLRDLGTSGKATAAMARLAEAIQDMIQYMRDEQDTMRTSLDQHTSHQRRIEALLQRYLEERSRHVHKEYDNN